MRGDDPGCLRGTTLTGAFLYGDFRNFKLMPRLAGDSTFHRKFRVVGVRPMEFLVFGGHLTNVILVLNNKKMVIYRH